MLTIYVVLPFSGFDGAKVELIFETCNIFVCFLQIFWPVFIGCSGFDRLFCLLLWCLCRRREPIAQVGQICNTSIVALMVVV